MKQRINFTYLWLLIYEAVALIVQLIVLRLPDGIIDEGTLMITSVVLGLVVLFFASKKKYPINVFESKKKMTVATFVGAMGLVFLIQGITTIVMVFFTSLGATGLSIPYEFDSFSFILYAGIIGPIGEELVFRGFVPKNLKQGGRIAAIVLSALAFGLMHGNLEQFVLASLMGLVFGYIAMEYSIWWTILIHFINNFVLGYGLDGLLPEDLMVIVNGIMFALFGAIGIAICYFRRGVLKEFFTSEENKMQPGFLKSLCSSVWFWIYTVIYIATIIILMVVGVEL